MPLKFELTPPDISNCEAGNIGIPYYNTFDSGKPGLHILINSVTHGNELCSAVTVDNLCRHNVRPTLGKLSFDLANYWAYIDFDPAAPTASR